MQEYKISSFEDFQGVFKTEKDCQDYLFHVRWGDGFVCPKCGYNEYYFIKRRKLYQCKTCGHQASVTAGTVFHKTKTPLKKWFLMIYLMVNQKTGQSVLSLQKILDINLYKTALSMANKIRACMEEHNAKQKLAGLVELSKVSLTHTDQVAGEDNPRWIVFETLFHFTSNWKHH